MSVNKVILIGNVGRDADIKTFDDQSSIVNFSLATTERGYKLQNGTEVPEKTEWHNIVLRGKRATALGKYITKGIPLYVEGKIRTETYDKNGEKRYTTKIYVDDVQFLGRKDDAQKANNDSATQHIPQGYYDQQPQPPQDETDNLPF